MKGHIDREELLKRWMIAIKAIGPTAIQDLPERDQDIIATEQDLEKRTLHLESVARALGKKI